MTAPICFVVSRLTQTGPIIVVEDIIRNLDRGRWQPIVVSLRSEENLSTIQPRFEAMGCQCLSLDRSLLSLEMRTAAAARHLADLLHTKGVRLVHSHGYHPDLVATKLPPEEFTTVNTLHNICVQDYIYGKGKILGKYMSHRYIAALPQLTAHVGISDLVCRFYREMTTGKIHPKLICNGSNTDRFFVLSEEKRSLVRSSMKIGEQACVFIYSGSLSERKNPVLLIESFRDLYNNGDIPQDSVLLIAGCGPLEDACRRAIPVHLAQNIRLLGFRREVEKDLAAADIALTASRSEGFGLNVIEALLCGLPVVASDIPAHLEILSSFPVLRSLSFALDNKQALMDAMMRAVALRRKYGRQEISTQAIACFSAKRMSEAYQNLYNGLLLSKIQ